MKTKKMNNLSVLKIVLFGTTLISIVAVIFYIFYCTKGMFHSDMAYWLLLSDEQIRTGQLYPDGFYYTTGLPTFISTQSIVLLLRLFSSNWLLCRELAVALIAIVIFVLVYYFFKKIIGKFAFYPTCITIILFCFPMYQYFETYYEAAYAWQIIWDMVLVIVIHSIFSLSSFGKNKKTLFHFIILFILAFVLSMGSKNIILFILPSICALLALSLMENEFHIESVFKTAMYRYTVLLIFLGMILGFGSYIILSRNVTETPITGGMSFVSSEQIVDNIKTFITNILKFYYSAQESSMLSLTGITSCINFAIMCISAFIAPVWGILYFRKTQNKIFRFYVIYAWISNLFNIYFMIFSNVIVPPETQRYYQPVFWHNVVFTALFLSHIIKNSDKYRRGLIVIIMIVAVLFGHLNYIVKTVIPIHETYIAEEKNGSLIDFLKANQLTYGFASFWNAYKYMALSNGEITLISYYPGSPLTPYNWMTSSSYYDVDTHQGRSFLMLDQTEQLDPKFYSAASEIKEYNGYTILIYDKHLYLYEELK